MIPTGWLPRVLIAVVPFVAAAAGLCPDPGAADLPPQRVGTEGQRAGEDLASYLDDIRQFLSSTAPNVPDSFLSRDPEWLGAVSGLLCSRAAAGDHLIPPRIIEAAVLLHLSAAMAPGFDRFMPERHYRWAAAIVDRARPRLPTVFQRRFAVAAVWFWQGRTALREAAQALDDALERFGPDADLLLAQGTLWEALAALKDEERPKPMEGKALGAILTAAPRRGEVYTGGRVWVGVRKMYEQCASVFARALQLAPDLDEARVRLAHVQIMLERHADAAATVAPLVRRQPGAVPPGERRVAYFGALMHGRALLGSGATDDALASMRLAQSICPECQTAGIAVSQALRAAGDNRSADDTMLAVLRAGQRPQATFDPWWDYPAGQWWRLPALIADLFDEARR